MVVEVGARPTSSRAASGHDSTPRRAALSVAVALALGGILGSLLTAGALRDGPADAIVPAAVPQPAAPRPSIVPGALGDDGTSIAGCGGLRSAVDIQYCFEHGWDEWARDRDGSAVLPPSTGPG
jgi:hypothetical protein